MLGQGWVSTRTPLPCSISRPASSNSAAETPGSGRVAEPGFVAVRPGSGEIMIAPVSVCHQVSTIGQRSPPTTEWDHSHAFGLVGAAPEQPQRRQVVLGRVLLAPFHAGADRGGGGVEDRDPVRLDDLPPDVL